MRTVMLVLCALLPLVVPLMPSAQGTTPYVVVIDPTNAAQMDALHCTVTSTSTTGFWSYRNVTAVCPAATIPNVGPTACSNPAVFVHMEGNLGHQYVDGRATCTGNGATAYCQVGSPFTGSETCVAIANDGIDLEREDGGSLVCTWLLSYRDLSGYQGSKTLCSFGLVAWPTFPPFCIEVLGTPPFLHVSTTGPCDPEDPACVGLSNPGPLLSPQPLNCLFPDGAAAQATPIAPTRDPGASTVLSRALA